MALIFKLHLPLTLLLLCAVVLFPLLSPAAVQAQAILPTTQVVTLHDTPHLWIRGTDGRFHWAGDTRALSGRPIDWSARVVLSHSQMQFVPIGTPYLSAGLLKLGEPIFLVKWETDQAKPTLLHIQSIADVEQFGINVSNYGALVFEQPEWERRFGFQVGELSRGVLERAVPPPPDTETGPGFIALDMVGPGAKMAGLNLRGVNLNNANLYRADLHNADLTDARARNANLVGANLHGAILRNTDLRGADLTDAGLYTPFHYRSRCEAARARGALVDHTTICRN